MEAELGCDVLVGLTKGNGLIEGHGVAAGVQAGDEYAAGGILCGGLDQGGNGVVQPCMDFVGC
ncbi:hypothetical protein D3C86_2244210 [compost metagenome]